MVRNIGEKREEMARKLAEAEENKKESNTFDTSEEEQQLSSDANDEKSNANIVGGSHNGPKIAAGKNGNNIKSCCFCFLYHNDIDNKDENHPEPENNDNQEIDKNKKINQYLDMMIDRIFGPKRPNRKFIIRRFLLASFMAMGLAIGLGVWLGGGNGGDGESAAGGSLGGHGASNVGGACENDDMCDVDHDPRCFGSSISLIPFLVPVSSFVGGNECCSQWGFCGSGDDYCQEGGRALLRGSGGNTAIGKIFRN